MHGFCTRNSRLTLLLKVHSDGLFLVSAVRDFQALTARVSTDVSTDIYRSRHRSRSPIRNMIRSKLVGQYSTYALNFTSVRGKHPTHTQNARTPVKKCVLLQHAYFAGCRLQVEMSCLFQLKLNKIQHKG